MDNDGRTPSNDLNQKELTISLAASSMINASDVITPEAYQANLKRIQEVKEMVQRLESNNEAAHKNFILDQLEKRAKEGREAEDMLARLRNQQGLSETVQLTNNVPGSDRSEDILPTTASVVEVPESRFSPSYSSPAPTVSSHSPQTIQQGRPVKPQWTLPPQIQPYSPEVVFQYYTPPQHNTMSYPQASIGVGQRGGYTTVPPQSRVHNPPIHQTGFQQLQVQQPSQSWNSYSPQVIALPGPATVPGRYTLPAGRTRTAPIHGGSSARPSNSTYHEPGPQPEPSTSRPSFTAHNQSQSPSPLAQLQTPLQAIPAMSAQTTPGQHPPVRSHSKPLESQSHPVSTAASKPVLMELQPPHKPSQPSHQQPQRLPQPLQSQQHPQQLQARLPSQQPLQLPETYLQNPPQPVDRASSTRASQPYSQPVQPIIAQEQQRGKHPRVDRATFIKLFQNAVQRGALHLKAFWFQAKASGISDEWLMAAISSLPLDVWQSVMAQINQSGPIIDAALPANTPRQHVSTIPGPNVSVINPLPPPPPPSVTPVVQTVPVTQQTTKLDAPTDGSITRSAPGQTFGPYAAQLQYYAEQATKSSLTQVPDISAAPTGNTTPTQTAVVTPKRDIPHERVEVRTPKDANKSTLARDILRSLGVIASKPPREAGAEPTDKANNHEDDQQPEAVPVQPGSLVVSPTVAPPAIDFDDSNSPSTPSAKTNVQDEPQHVATPGPVAATSILKEGHGQVPVTEGPIMIDLTLEDSEESVGEKGQEHAFSIQTSANAVASPQPNSPTNTTNHTPRLENLSLEESPVDVATDSNHVDVRMYSPVLSPAAEANMRSNLLCPQPGSVEPVSPSFEPLPHGTSEQPPESQLPLFLPSPPISPAPTSPPETDPEMIYDDSESHSLKRRFVNIGEMDIDGELVTPPRVKKRPKKQVYVLIPSAPLYVKKAMKKKERAMGEGIDSELEGVGEDEEPQYSHLEQLLIEESKSRLLERRCRWLNCASVLNCAVNLFTHLKIHAREEDSQAPFYCHWATCHRRFHTEQERDVHLETHTIRPLPCPFAGCDEQFDKPLEVMHHEVQHQKADRRESLIRKPTYEPIVPAIPARLGPPPHQLPSHRVIPRRVVKCRISADRHATLGPWILWNIFSPVELDMRKQNASMRGRPTRQTISYDMDSTDVRRDDYDFLLALSSYPIKNRQLDDLDSALITMSAARGLTLWGSASHVSPTAGSATPGVSANAVPVALAVDAAVPSTERNSVSDGRQSGQFIGMGEKDAVEQMLVS